MQVSKEPHCDPSSIFPPSLIVDFPRVPISPSDERRPKRGECPHIHILNAKTEECRVSYVATAPIVFVSSSVRQNTQSSAPKAHELTVRKDLIHFYSTILKVFFADSSSLRPLES